MSLKQLAVCTVVAVISIIASNIRWKRLCKCQLFKGCTPQVLPYVSVKPKTHQQSAEEKPAVILIHGMWHSPLYFGTVQEKLAEADYASYAIDMLPGERVLPGGTQLELVADLEQTLTNILELSQNTKPSFVFLGHSQGGLVVQSALHRSEAIRKSAAGAVMLGTFPLGMTPPMDLLRQEKNMYQPLGYGWLCLRGKLLNKDYLKHIFLSESTDLHDKRITKYVDQLLAAPSDGCVTVSHFIGADLPTPISDIPVLILGAKEDIIYPPDLLVEGFKERFPGATHVTAAGQAHCFMDSGWEETMLEPFINWLNQL